MERRLEAALDSYRATESSDRQDEQKNNADSYSIRWCCFDKHQCVKDSPLGNRIFSGKLGR